MPYRTVGGDSYHSFSDVYSINHYSTVTMIDNQFVMSL